MSSICWLNTPRVKISLVGVEQRGPVTWPYGWPMPRVDDEVSLPSHSPASMFVRVVEWCPEGDITDDTAPFVYIVIGPTKRERSEGLWAPGPGYRGDHTHP